MSKLFQKWHAAASREERTDFAARVGVTFIYLYSLAKGRYKISADLAGHMEKAAQAINLKRRRKRLPELPTLPRRKLAEACANCPYAKACADHSVVINGDIAE